MIAINSQINLVNSIHEDFSQLEIKNETMLFNCDREHAYKYGNRITKAFLNALPKDWKDENVPIVVDSRSHMLMKGWYPCIPGWHHDDVPRDRADGQPEYEKPTYRSEHIMMLVNAEVCPTEFALGAANFEIPPLRTKIYEAWHDEVESRIQISKFLNVFECPDKTLVKFDDRTWHQGTQAKGNGWRFFIRASRYFDSNFNVIDRKNPRTNEIRKQSQVYLPAVTAGW